MERLHFLASFPLPGTCKIQLHQQTDHFPSRYTLPVMFPSASSFPLRSPPPPHPKCYGFRCASSTHSLCTCCHPPPLSPLGPYAQKRSMQRAERTSVLHVSDRTIISLCFFKKIGTLQQPACHSLKSYAKVWESGVYGRRLLGWSLVEPSLDT